MSPERPQELQLDCFDETVLLHFSMSSKDGAHAGGPMGLLPVRSVRVRRNGTTVAIEVELASVQVLTLPNSC